MGVRFGVTTLFDILSYRAAENGESKAFTFLSEHLDTQSSWTYHELHVRAATLATRIRQQCQPSERVLLSFGHGPEFIASFFGCLYAGVVPVPIQPLRGARDVARLSAIVRDTGATLGLTTLRFLPKLVEIKCLDEAERLTWFAADSLSVRDQGPPLDYSRVAPDSIAYLQYTSGSTRNPRGVVISHSNVMSNLKAIDEDFHHDSGSVGVTWLPHFHDMGLVYGLFQPLFNGFHCFVLSPASFSRRPLCWLEAISRFGGTHSGGPNFSYELCVRRTNVGERLKLNLASWRVAFNGAEVVRRETLKQFSEAFSVCGFHSESFYPTYGLAEATLKVCGNFITKDPKSATDMDLHSSNEPISCGTPARGTEIRIVDQVTSEQMPSGEVGEIWVSGPGVALGYWNKPDETTAVFKALLTDASEGGNRERGYLRTGDLGILGPTGLQICGRLKDVAIIRGTCHYPEDIEWAAQIVNPSGIHNQSAAFTVDIEGEERLVIAQEVGPHPPPNPEDWAKTIRSSVAIERELQVYAIVFVTSLPKTSSGKVIRYLSRSLYLEGSSQIVYISRLDQNDQEPDRDRQHLIQPRTGGDELQQVAGVLIETLKSAAIPRLSLEEMNTHLTSLGVDSLGAMQICHAIEITFGIEISVREALESTPAILSRKVLEALSLRKTRRSSDLLPYQDDLDLTAIRVSPEQERLWLMHEIAPKRSLYNLAAAVRIYGNLDVSVFQSALLEVENKNRSIKQSFYRKGDILFARENPTDIAQLRILNVSTNGKNSESIADNYIQAEIDRPFDLSRGPLMRALLIQVQDRYAIALFVFHHIICDLWSLRVFVKALFKTYEVIHEHQDLRKLWNQIGNYSDFVADCGHSLNNSEHLDYWVRELSGAPSSIPLCLDKARPTTRSFEAKEVSSVFSGSTYGCIRQLAEHEGTTPFVILLAAFVVLLHQLSKSEDIVVATPHANRDRAEFRDVIGLFAHPMALRIGLEGNPSFREIIGRVRAKVLSALEHNNVPFASIIERINPQRIIGAVPLTQVFFAVNSPVLEDRSVGNLKLEPYSVCSSATDFDLQLGVVIHEGDVTATLRFAADIFERSWAEGLLKGYEDILTSCTADCECHPLQGGAPLQQEDTAGSGALSVSVASSFAAEPLEEFLSFWAQECKLPLKLDFAPVGQLFQSLLQAGVGAEGKLCDARVLMVRIEDWTRGSADPDKTVIDFVSLLRCATEATNIPQIVCICPKSPSASTKTELQDIIMRCELLLTESLEAVPRTTVIRAVDAIKCYSVERYDDETSESIGGLPYTDEFYAAVGTVLFRKLFALQRTSYKVIVCDCDNTLWRGVVAEDGADGLYVTEINRKLHKLLFDQKQSGVLLCLCSKNEVIDIERAFANVVGLGVQRSDFVVERINWSSKSENIKSIANELNLALDDFIFIDDDPLECAEVRASCPEVHIIELSESVDATFLDHYWVFDTVDRGFEDSRRTQYYRQDQARTTLLRSFNNLEDFINSLDLKIISSRMASIHLDRVIELMFRTTQFNTVGLKLSLNELQSAMQSGKLSGLTFHVSDKFGDYGLVGVVLLSERRTALVVESMMLSCRALGRGVEHRMAAECGRVAIERGLANVSFRFVSSVRNRPSHQFLESVIGNALPQAEFTVYQVSAVTASQLRRSKEEASRKIGHQVERNLHTSDMARYSATEFVRIARNFRSACSILSSTRAAVAGVAVPLAERAPMTEIEHIVADIWGEVLRLKVSDISSEFFDLGGDSLKAVRVLSNIQNKLGVELPLTLFFQGHATVSELSSAVEEALSDDRRRVGKG